MSGSWQAERLFGRGVGSVLMLLGAWLAWRGRYPAGWALLGTGALLALLGVARPRALSALNRGWMALAEALAFVSTRVILGAVFLLLVTPLGLVMRLSGWDPLRRRAPGRASHWVPYSARQQDPKHYEKMF